MPGFYISNYETECSVNNFYNNRCFKQEIFNDKFKIKRNTLKRFEDDKIFIETKNYILITEGVILNKKELMNKYNINDFIELLSYLLNKEDEDFFKDFRGSFSGAIYNKSIDEWIIYTNHVGDNAVFYYFNDGKFIVGSEINYIVETLKNNKIEYTINENSIYHELTYSFMIDDNTLLNEVKRIGPGQYIKIKKDDLSVHKYFELNNNTYELEHISETELINEIDERFRKAIILEYEKDKEYGYNYFAELSGGLDSRMNLWVANELGYKGIKSVTYCKTGYLDQRIAEEIGVKLEHNWIFKSLDDPSIIYDLEENIQMSFGLNCYFNITKSNATYKNLNFDNIGMCHTGQIGDVVISSFINSEKHNKMEDFKFYESNKLLSRVDKKYLMKYDNEEMFGMNVRAFRGALNSHLIRKNYFETVSPFLDVDFLQFCMSIPLKYRAKHSIYKKWIMTKYPSAAKIIWEKTGLKVSASDLHIFINKVKKYAPNKVKKMLRIPVKAQINSMNPYDYWYENNKEVKSFMDNYFTKHISKSKLSKNLNDDMKYLYYNGTAFEKAQVLTILAAIKLYFN